jgi:FkbM family methyltransferase
MTDPHLTWKTAEGDATLALDWPISENALVWEIGGFEGRWAAQMAEKFNPRIEIFEPQFWAADKLVDRFTDNPKVTVHYYGLWIKDAWLPMGDYYTDGASILKPGEPPIESHFKDIRSEIDRADEIDVCLMNIEGAEYNLIPWIVADGGIKKIRFFWCQFHTFVENSEELKTVIYNILSLTHDLLWDYYPTAVAWRRKP